MKRMNLFEFNDRPWWPTAWKNMETDYLGAADRFLQLYRPAVERLGVVLRSLRCHRIVDLCSGAAGHLAPAIRQIEARQLWNVSVTLTDLNPNLRAYRRAQGEDGRIGFVESPVDATRVPAELKGFRTMFAGLHHFGPEQVAGILADTVRRREGVAVFEHTSRSLTGVLAMLGAPLLVWALTPFIRPVTLPRLFWTYVLPVIPLAILWDGIVSSLRSYTSGEMLAMARGVSGRDYRWDAEEFRVCGLLTVTLLIGHPADAGEGPEPTPATVPEPVAPAFVRRPGESVATPA